MARFTIDKLERCGSYRNFISHPIYIEHIIQLCVLVLPWGGNNFLKYFLNLYFRDGLYMNISKNGGLIKAILENLSNILWYAQVPSIGRRVTMGGKSLNFLLRNTLVENTGDTYFKQESVIPIMLTQVMEESFLLVIGQVGRQDTSDKVVDIIIPRNCKFSYRWCLLWFLFYVRFVILEKITEMSITGSCVSNKCYQPIVGEIIINGYFFSFTIIDPWQVICQYILNSFFYLEFPCKILVVVKLNESVSTSYLFYLVGT